MRHISSAILLLFFLLSQTLVGQQNAAVGLLFDHNQNPIDGYIASDYTPETKLSIVAYINETYRRGSYYDLDNQKIEGYIKYTPGNDHFLFSLDGEKKDEKIKAKECQAMVMGLDSFKVIKNFQIHSNLLTQNILYPKFAQVIETFDNRTYYSYLQKGLNSNTNYNLYTDHVKPDIICVAHNSKKFHETAIKAFSNYPILIELINSNDYNKDDFLELIKVHKYLWAWNNDKPIYFDQNLRETNDSSEASYYLVVDSIFKNSYKISYYNINGTKNYEGQFKSIYPFKKKGLNKWFHSNGQVRKEIVYTDNKAKNINVFNENGVLQYSYYFDEYNNKNHYTVVNDDNGNDQLNTAGNGKVVIHDPIRGKSVQFSFQKNFLVSAYYLNDKEEKIYLRAKKDIKLKAENSLNTQIKNAFIYPDSSFEAGNDGTVYLLFLINKKGRTEDITILKGIDKEIDKRLLNIFEFTKTYKKFRPAKSGKEKVMAEVVVPIQLVLQSHDPFRNNNMYWMDQQMFMQRMMMPPTHINPPAMPPSSF